MKTVTYTELVSRIVATGNPTLGDHLRHAVEAETEEMHKLRRYRDGGAWARGEAEKFYAADVAELLSEPAAPCDPRRVLGGRRYATAWAVATVLREAEAQRAGVQP